MPASREQLELGGRTMVCGIQLCLCNVGFQITLRREFLSPYGPSVDVVALLLLLLLYAPLPSRNMPTFHLQAAYPYMKREWRVKIDGAWTTLRGMEKGRVKDDARYFTKLELRTGSLRGRYGLLACHNAIITVEQQDSNGWPYIATVETTTKWITTFFEPFARSFSR